MNFDFVRIIRSLPLIAFALIAGPVDAQEAYPGRNAILLDIKAARSYRADFANGNRNFEALIANWRAGDYDARQELRQGMDELLAKRSMIERNETLERDIAETVNELLQGHIIEGNRFLLDALRARFPRSDFDPQNPPPVLPRPQGNTRDETLELERAIEAFTLGSKSALDVLPLRDGDQILRASTDLYPGFPQFTTMFRPFETADNLLDEYDVQVELSYLSKSADRAAQASVEKGKKLFNLSTMDAEAKNEALTELKRGSHHAYILSAALSSVQSRQEFEENGGQKMLVHTQLARELYNRIRAGFTPYGNSKQFIPNGSIENFIGQARRAIAEAREAERDARLEQQYYNWGEQDRQDEILQLQANFIVPLTTLTNLDPRNGDTTHDPENDNPGVDLDRDGNYGELEPEGEDLDGDGRAGEFENFEDLQTVRGRRLYREEVIRRVNTLLNRDYEPGFTTQLVGTLGNRVLEAMDARFIGEIALNNLQNIPKRIEIEEERIGTVVDVILSSAETIGALQIAENVANMFTVSAGVSGVEPTFEISANPGAILAGALQAAQTRIQAIQEADISEADSAATIKNILLEQANAQIEVERSKLLFDQVITQLRLDYQTMDQIINDYAEAINIQADRWYNDPTYVVQLGTKIRRANDTFERTVIALYNLARALEYEWVETYRNPVITGSANVAPTLDSPLFDQFTEPEDVFGIRSVDEAQDFLNALENWDLKLRSIGSNGIAVRGPNRGTPLNNRPISLRDDILGLAGDDGNPRDVEDRIVLFRDFLMSNLIPTPPNAKKPGFRIEFGLSLEIPNEPVQPILPASGLWNLRIGGIRIETEADAGFNELPDCTYTLTQRGVVGLQSFFDSTRPLEERIITKFSIPAGDRPERSVFGAVVDSRINGQMQDGLTINDYENIQLSHQRIDNGPIRSGRPMAASRWQLEFDTTRPKNFEANIMKLRDIKIILRYTHGNPREFAWNQN